MREEGPSVCPCWASGLSSVQWEKALKQEMWRELLLSEGGYYKRARRVQPHGQCDVAVKLQQEGVQNTGDLQGGCWVGSCESMWGDLASWGALSPELSWRVYRSPPALPWAGSHPESWWWGEARLQGPWRRHRKDNAGSWRSSAREMGEKLGLLGPCLRCGNLQAPPGLSSQAIRELSAHTASSAPGTQRRTVSHSDTWTDGTGRLAHAQQQTKEPFVSEL